MKDEKLKPESKFSLESFELWVKEDLLDK